MLLSLFSQSTFSILPFFTSFSTSSFYIHSLLSHYFSLYFLTLFFCFFLYTFSLYIVNPFALYIIYFVTLFLSSLSLFIFPPSSLITFSLNIHFSLFTFSLHFRTPLSFTFLLIFSLVFSLHVLFLRSLHSHAYVPLCFYLYFLGLLCSLFFIPLSYIFLIYFSNFSLHLYLFLSHSKFVFHFLHVVTSVYFLSFH